MREYYISNRPTLHEGTYFLSMSRLYVKETNVAYGRLVDRTNVMAPHLLHVRTLNRESGKMRKVLTEREKAFKTFFFSIPLNFSLEQFRRQNIFSPG